MQIRLKNYPYFKYKKSNTNAHLKNGAPWDPIQRIPTETTVIKTSLATITNANIQSK